MSKVMSTNNTLNVRQSTLHSGQKYFVSSKWKNASIKRLITYYELMIVFCFRLWCARWSLLHDFQKLRTRVRWLHRSCLFLGQCHRGRYVCCWFCGNGASPDVGKHIKFHSWVGWTKYFIHMITIVPFHVYLLQAHGAHITGHPLNDIRIIGSATSVLLIAIVIIGMDWEAKVC